MTARAGQAEQAPVLPKRINSLYIGNRCCGFGSGSGWIRIIFPDLVWDRHPGHAGPNPGRYQFQANEKVNKLYFFPWKYNMLSKILKNYDIFDTDEKEKNCYDQVL